MRTYLADPEPTIDPRREPAYRNANEAHLNASVVAAVRPSEVDQLRPVPAPPVRSARNFLAIFLQPWTWWSNHRNTGRKVTLNATVDVAHEQHMPVPIPLHRGDSIRIQPEPWATGIPFGGQ